MILLLTGSILPVHPDAVEDDGEADVQDEVDNSSNHEIFQGYSCCNYFQDDAGDYLEDEESVAESQVYSNEFVVFNSYSVNFQAGKYEIDY